MTIKLDPNQKPTLEQLEKMAREDPRVLQIFPAGTGYGLRGAIINDDKRKICFGTPSGAALYISLSQRAWLSSESILEAELFEFNTEARSWGPTRHETLYNMFEERMANIIFAYTAVEAFANESIPNEYEHKATRSDGRCTEVYSREQIERNLSLDLKLGSILPQVFNVQTPKGTKLWESYLELKQLRDRLVHLKHYDATGRPGLPEPDTVWAQLYENRHYDYSKSAHQIISYFAHATRIWVRRYPYWRRATE
ncbi:hypothetical protein [Sorangium sp. So ce1151]|uniref:hypothetical protein n=1 Tax=Sorangium sp. So ce1151 TaxID=3133332 RepID=UPI003F60A03C